MLSKVARLALITLLGVFLVWLLVTTVTSLLGELFHQETWEVTVIEAPQLAVSDLYVIVEKDGALVHLNNEHSLANPTKDPAILQAKLIPGKRYRIEVAGIVGGFNLYMNIVSATPIE